MLGQQFFIQKEILDQKLKKIPFVVYGPTLMKQLVQPRDHFKQL